MVTWVDQLSRSPTVVRIDPVRRQS